MAKKDKGVLTGDPVTYQASRPAGGVQMETFIPWTLVKRSVKRQIVTPLDAPNEFEIHAKLRRREQDALRHTPLIRALGLAHYWQRLLDDGKYGSLTEIAAVEGIDRGQASRIAQLARLAPGVAEACIDGDGNGLALEHLIRGGIATDWDKQRLKSPNLRGSETPTRNPNSRY